MGWAVTETKSFWQTVPGVITAVAALVTAVGGLIGILVQSGLFGSGDDQRAVATPPSVEASTIVDQTPSSASSPSSGQTPEESPVAQSPEPAGGSPDLVPWTRATATIVRADGRRTEVRASTVNLSCGAPSVTFASGQTIPLERVRSIAITAVFASNATADATVTLLDGRRTSDTISTRNCPVQAETDLGPVVVELSDVRRIGFGR